MYLDIFEADYAIIWIYIRLFRASQMRIIRIFPKELLPTLDNTQDLVWTRKNKVFFWHYPNYPPLLIRASWSIFWKPKTLIYKVQLVKKGQKIWSASTLFLDALKENVFFFDTLP